MTNRNSQLAGRRSCSGFTLIELLTVIGIIVVLIGILVPTVQAVRNSAYAASSASQVSQLQLVIGQYYSEWHAYPGPLSNDQARGGAVPSINGTALSGAELVEGGDPLITAAAAPGNITGTENLVLGLLGGLRYQATPTPRFWFDPAAVGGGPFSLNPQKLSRSKAYMDVRPGDISTAGQFFRDHAERRVVDTTVPEFIDRFPQPMPLLYFRASAGAPGVIGRYKGSGFAEGSHYVLDHGNAYTLSQGFPAGSTASAPPDGLSIGVPRGTYHGLRFVGNGVDGTGDGYNATGARDGYAYFVSPGTNQPRAKDEYILVSPGKDRIYGTDDDITSFGAVR